MFVMLAFPPPVVYKLLTTAEGISTKTNNHKQDEKMTTPKGDLAVNTVKSLHALVSCTSSPYRQHSCYHFQ